MPKKVRFQRIDENIFKLMEDKYSTEELQAIWGEDKNGEYIQFSDDGSARYIVHGIAVKTIVHPTSQRTMSRFVGGDQRKQSVTQDVPAEEGGDADKQRLALVKQWCGKNGIFPNIWYVNERGNIELVDPRTGQFLGGLV